MMTVYGTSEAARRLGINPKRLKRWLDHGFFETDYRGLLGKSELRLFSERDISDLETVIGRIDNGMPIVRAFLQGGE